MFHCCMQGKIWQPELDQACWEYSDYSESDFVIRSETMCLPMTSPHPTPHSIPHSSWTQTSTPHYYTHGPPHTITLTGHPTLLHSTVTLHNTLCHMTQQLPIQFHAYINKCPPVYTHRHTHTHTHTQTHTHTHTDTQHKWCTFWNEKQNIPQWKQIKCSAMHFNVHTIVHVLVYRQNGLRSCLGPRRPGEICRIHFQNLAEWENDTVCFC